MSKVHVSVCPFRITCTFETQFWIGKVLLLFSLELEWKLRGKLSICSILCYFIPLQFKFLNTSFQSLRSCYSKFLCSCENERHAMNNIQKDHPVCAYAKLNVRYLGESCECENWVSVHVIVRIESIITFHASIQFMIFSINIKHEWICKIPE